MIEFFAASFDITADLFSGSKEEKEKGRDKCRPICLEESVTTRESEIMIGWMDGSWMPPSDKCSQPAMPAMHEARKCSRSFAVRFVHPVMLMHV